MQPMLAFFAILATVVRGPADVESLTASADAVVYAQVVRRSSAWGAGGGEIFTTVVLRPIETWKGDAEKEISVLVPGGEVGELAQTVDGVARFRDDEQVVVFLRRRVGSVYSIDHFALGKFAVGAPPGLPKRALRDRRGLECAGCRPGESDDLSLDELRVRVLRSVRR